MGIQEARPDPIRERDVERDDVVVATNRCPFCHDDVRSEGADHVVCKACLTRHHEACWDEGGACSSCGGTEAMVSKTGAQTGPAQGHQAAETAPRNAPTIQATALVLMVLLGLMLMGGLGYASLSKPTPPPVPRVSAPPPAPPAPPGRPPGSFELNLVQRTQRTVEGIEGLEVHVGDVRTLGSTSFELRLRAPSGANTPDLASSLFFLRTGESHVADLAGLKFKLRFVRQIQRAVGDDQAVVWITPLD